MLNGAFNIEHSTFNIPRFLLHSAFSRGTRNTIHDEGDPMRKLPALLFSVVLVGACVKAPQESSSTATSTAPRSGPVRIGFSMDTLKEERWQRDQQFDEQRAKQVGAQPDVEVANGDDAVQTNQAEPMLTTGVDVLIVAPHNGEIAASIVVPAGEPPVIVPKFVIKPDPLIAVPFVVTLMRPLI